MSIIDDVERQRAQLEENAANLQKALRYWRTWDAEYEGLKEEMQTLSSSAGKDDVERVVSNFDGDLLNEKEIKEITKIDTADPREIRTIIRVVERRQDYVQQNIEAISRQYDAINRQLDRLRSSELPPETASDTGLPLSEIIEELDDDDNVISSRITRPEDSTAQIIDSLRKAGLEDVKAESSKSSVSDRVGPESMAISNGPIAQPSTQTKSDEASTSLDADVNTVEGVNADSPTAHDKPSLLNVPKAVSTDLLQGSFRGSDRVIEIDDDDELIGSTAILPKNESPEDAQLRREMLQYHLNEVGNVVAEIDILEGDSDDEFEDELADLEDGSDRASTASDISEEEDEHGRTLRPAITAEYRQEMKDLQRRLQGRLMQNLGPEQDLPDVLKTPSKVTPSDQRVEPDHHPHKRSSNAKSVRFAAELDLSSPGVPTESSHVSSTKMPVAVMPAAGPLTTPSQEQKIPVSSSLKKQSRFKQTSQDKAQDGESSAQSQPTVTEAVKGERPILSNSVLERSGTGIPANCTEPDEFDPELQQRQLAAEYYRRRNDTIRKQGGFKADEEEIDQPLMEESADGKVKKVSRFKAARMKF